MRCLSHKSGHHDDRHLTSANGCSSDMIYFPGDIREGPESVITLEECDLLHLKKPEGPHVSSLKKTV